jgi:hypothetical protein
LTSADQPVDNHRPAVDTVVDAISRHVTDLTLVGADELAAWLAALPVPAGWQIGRAQNSPVQPTRTIVHRRDPLTGWDACETIHVFRFNGAPPHDIVRLHADRTLRAGGAHHITSHPLPTPAGAAMTAVRSSGHLTLSNRQRIWAQYSTYIAGDDTQGLLIEHGIFTVPDRQAGLRDDIAELGNAVHDAFVSTMAAPEQDAHTSSSPGTDHRPPPGGTGMTIFHVGFFSGFDVGYDAVLVGADRDGMRMLQSAVRSAHDNGAASFEFNTIKHHIVRQDGAADIELGSQTIVWRFDDATLAEMLDLIEPLVDIIEPAHNYLDLNSPAETLILSVDEYAHGSPFAEFPHGEPVPPLTSAEQAETERA